MIKLLNSPKSSKNVLVDVDGSDKPASEKQLRELGKCELFAFMIVIPLTPQGAHFMVCNRSWDLPGNPKLVWHPARLLKEWGCVDLSMDNLHLKDPLVLFGVEGSALTFPLFLFSPRIIMLCHCSSTMTKDHFC